MTVALTPMTVSFVVVFFIAIVVAWNTLILHTTMRTLMVTETICSALTQNPHTNIIHTDTGHTLWHTNPNAILNTFDEVVVVNDCEKR